MKKNITLVISSLNNGGAEKNIVKLADYLVKHNRNVNLIKFSPKEPFFVPDNRVNIIDAYLYKDSYSFREKIINNLVRIKKIKKVIKKTNPDIVISFSDKTNILVSIALMFTNIPLIISERNYPKYNMPSVPFVLLRNITYNFCKRVHVQTNDTKVYFKNCIFRNKIRVIPNPVETLEGIGKENYNKVYRIIAVGRLTDQKGFDMLIDAFSLIHDKYPRYELVIYGEGSDRKLLENQVSDLGLGNKVSLPGITKRVKEQMIASDIFVLSSRFEGFPNVLCEAMTAGVPCIAFNCITGPSDIITNNEDGILVEPFNYKRLGDQMVKLINDGELRRSLGEKARNNIKRFDENIILNNWIQLIEEC